MPSHSEQKYLPYTPRQVFDLVADVERYPQFLPWCRAARVIERSRNEFLGELVISFNHMTESYVSRVTLTPPPGEHESCRIDVALVRGPFQHLVNRWQFIPEEQGTRVDFFLDFQFRSRMLEKLIGGMFARAAAKMVAAFSERADALYGKEGKP